MAKNRDAANAVMYGVEQVCALYGVDVLRMQSRVFTVVGKAGRNRPMFIGQWTDRNGTKHASGMADFLARPKVPLRSLIGVIHEDQYHIVGNPTHLTLPLWIECKSGEGKLSGEQQLFRDHVVTNGENHIAVLNSLDPLVEWFERMGVRK